MFFNWKCNVIRKVNSKYLKFSHFGSQKLIVACKSAARESCGFHWADISLFDDTWDKTHSSAENHLRWHTLPCRLHYNPYPLGTRRCRDVESTSLTLIQCRNNVAYSVGHTHKFTHLHNLLPWNHMGFAVVATHVPLAVNDVEYRTGMIALHRVPP